MSVRTKVLLAQAPLAVALVLIGVITERMNATLLLASLAAVLGGGLLSILITSRLLQPLALMTRTVQRIGAGEFDARIAIPGRDEVAQLASHVNAMAVQLSQYRRSSLGDLLLAQQSSQAAIDSLPDPVVVFDDHGGVLRNYLLDTR